MVPTNGRNRLTQAIEIFFFTAITWILCTVVESQQGSLERGLQNQLLDFTTLGLRHCINLLVLKLFAVTLNANKYLIQINVLISTLWDKWNCWNCVWAKCDIFHVTEGWEGGCDLKIPDMELQKKERSWKILKDPKPAKFSALPVRELLRAQELPAGPAGLGGEGMRSPRGWGETALRRGVPAL